MKDLFKRAGFTSILSSIVFLLLGILLVVNPDAMVQAVSYVIGVLLIAIGIVKVVSYFTSKMIIYFMITDLYMVLYV